MESPEESNGRQEHRPPAVWRLDTWAPRITSLVFGAVWLSGVVAFGSAIAGQIYQELRKPFVYQPAKATVTAYSPPVRKTDAFGDDASVDGEVRYTYVVAGTRYEGKHRIPASSKTDGQFEANARGASPGKEITAWYDPADPADSTLSPTAEPHRLGFMIFLMPFVMVGVGMIFYGLTGKGASFRLTLDGRAGGEGLSIGRGDEGLSIGRGSRSLLAYFVLSAISAFGYFGLCAVLDWKTAWAVGAVLLLVVVPGASLLIGRMLTRRSKRQPSIEPAEQPIAPVPAAVEASDLGIAPKMPGIGAKLVTMILVSLFWCGITGVFVVFAVSSLLKQREAARRFVATDGVVIASKVKTHEGDSDSGPTYEAIVKYRYEVNGRRYTSTRYAYGMWTSSDRRQAQRIVAAHPPGRKIKVWYDPHAPAESVLQLAVDTQDYFTLLFIQPFVIVGLALVGYTIWILIAHARAQRFIDQHDPLFGEIPGWGLAEQDIRGITIRPQRSPLRALYAFAAGYGIACFVSAFVIAFLLEGFEGGSARTIFTAFCVAVGLGLAAVLVTLTRRTQKAVLAIDTNLAKLTLTSPKRNLGLPFDQIDRWTVQIIPDPNGVTVNDVPLTRPLLSVVTRDGQKHDIRVFGTGDEMPFVARKVGMALAELTASRLATIAEDAAATPKAKPITGLQDLLNRFRKLRRQGSSRKDYKDIMP